MDEDFEDLQFGQEKDHRSDRTATFEQVDNLAS